MIDAISENAAACSIAPAETMRKPQNHATYCQHILKEVFDMKQFVGGVYRRLNSRLRTFERKGSRTSRTAVEESIVHVPARRQ